MPSEDTKILEFNRYQKSDKALFIIYADLECLIKRLMDVKLILKIYPQRKVSEHIPSSFLMSAISSFKSIENKHDVTEVKIV